MALIDYLLDHIMQISYEDLPSNVVESAKKSVLDILACMIAGSSDELTEKMVRLATRWGGSGECIVPLYDTKLPAPTAALLNCIMARAVDFDDVHETGGRHVGASIIPPAFVFAEYSKRLKDKPVSGQSFISAIAMAYDLHCRLAMAGGQTMIHGGWQSETHAPIAIAAAGSKILGFDAVLTSNALGIAYCQCGYTGLSYKEGTDTVRVSNGLSGKSGVLAVELADQGITGPRDILEDPKCGWYPLYMQGDFSPETFTRELGKHFEGPNVSIKFYPAAKGNHQAIYAVLQLIDAHRIKPEDVKRVTITTGTKIAYSLGSEAKRFPETASSAILSFYYPVAVALVKGKPRLQDFTKEAIGNPDVLKMCSKIEIIADPKKDIAGVVQVPTDIEIETENGERYGRTNVQVIPGHPDNPASMADVIQKLVDCIPFSVKPISASNLKRIVNLVENLDRLDDVTLILECLK